MASQLLHYAAGLVAAIALTAIWRSVWQFIAGGMTRRQDQAIAAAIATAVPALIAYAAFVLGARL